MGALNFLFIVLLASVAYGQTCTPDSYSNLPAAPGTPTTTLASNLHPTINAANPLTTAHWSETAKLSDYRPPSSTYTANPSQSGCPHTQSGLRHWHDASTWGQAGVPVNGATVRIPANTNVLVSSCSVDSSFVFGIVYIPVGSSLIFGDANINFAARGFNVSGSLVAGSPSCRLRNKITITLHGRRSDYSFPVDPHIKGISVTGTIDIHGAQYFPTWTRLAVTAKIGDEYIFIQDNVNWQPGQKIVITTTEVKDSRDFNRNEERTIVSVQRTNLGSGVTAIRLNAPLSYLHFGGREYQAEVSLLSRNIIIQGDEVNSPPIDTDNAVCTSPNDGSTYPCEKKYLLGFGAHVIVHSEAASGRFSGVEMFRVGQTNVLGRYPIHFHMMNNLTSSNYQRAYVQDSAVHDSYFRCYAIHGKFPS